MKGGEFISRMNLPNNIFNMNANCLIWLNCYKMSDVKNEQCKIFDFAYN